MTNTFVRIHHSPIAAMLEGTRSLMNHQSALNTAILGPMLQITTLKGDAKGYREKKYTIYIDYDMGWYGRRLRIYIVRSRRYGPYKSTRIDIPPDLLNCFEAEGAWRSTYLPYLEEMLARLPRIPSPLKDDTATVSASTRISSKPPMSLMHRFSADL